ncbi:uncharacterized protein VTP21DRAFT_11333 [Calcarisporiella thermophila]|uniref:uncharacterized protein n=1 Tax=Calcarisporiella thermophila TaxID=911321 RepID=UPI00374424A3
MLNDDEDDATRKEQLAQLEKSVEQLMLGHDRAKSKATTSLELTQHFDEEDEGDSDERETSFPVFPEHLDIKTHELEIPGSESQNKRDASTKSANEAQPTFISEIPQDKLPDAARFEYKTLQRDTISPPLPPKRRSEPCSNNATPVDIEYVEQTRPASMKQTRRSLHTPSPPKLEQSSLLSSSLLPSKQPSPQPSSTKQKPSEPITYLKKISAPLTQYTSPSSPYSVRTRAAHPRRPTMLGVDTTTELKSHPLVPQPNSYPSQRSTPSIMEEVLPPLYEQDEQRQKLVQRNEYMEKPTASFFAAPVSPTRSRQPYQTPFSASIGSNKPRIDSVSPSSSTDSSTSSLVPRRDQQTALSSASFSSTDEISERRDSNDSQMESPTPSTSGSNPTLQQLHQCLGGEPNIAGALLMYSTTFFPIAKWRRRHCVLAGRSLYMYKSCGSDSQPATEAIELDAETSVFVCDEFPGKPFVIKITPKGKSHYLQTENSTEMSRWLSALKEVVGRCKLELSMREEQEQAERLTAREALRANLEIAAEDRLRMLRSGMAYRLFYPTSNPSASLPSLPSTMSLGVFSSAFAEEYGLTEEECILPEDLASLRAHFHSFDAATLSNDERLLKEFLDETKNRSMSTPVPPNIRGNIAMALAGGRWRRGIRLRNVVPPAPPPPTTLPPPPPPPPPHNQPNSSSKSVPEVISADNGKNLTWIAEKQSAGPERYQAGSAIITDLASTDDNNKGRPSCSEAKWEKRESERI